jgi:hypothetical protein
MELINADLPHAGSYSAHECGYDSCTEYIQQQVTVPANSQLVFWWYMTSQEGTTTAHDYFKVELYRPDNGLLATLRIRDNRVRRGLWLQDTIDWSQWAGRTVLLRFTTTTDGTATSAFYIDDVGVR